MTKRRTTRRRDCIEINDIPSTVRLHGVVVTHKGRTVEKEGALIVGPFAPGFSSTGRKMVPQKRGKVQGDPSALRPVVAYLLCHIC